jgi:hypothetical protein
VFTFEFLDVTGVVNVFMSAQVVLVGKFSSACWTWIGTLLGREMYGEVNVEKGLADGDVWALVTLVGSGTRGHILGAEAACGWIPEFVGVVEMASEGKAIGESLDTQRALVDVWEMCLYVEGSLKGIVRPVDTVGAGVAATESQRLGLVHALGRGDK